MAYNLFYVFVSFVARSLLNTFVSLFIRDLVYSLVDLCVLTHCINEFRWSVSFLVYRIVYTYLYKFLEVLHRVANL